MKQSKALIKEEKKWIGKKVEYFLYTLARDQHMDGPYNGIVTGVGENSQLIEDGLEGHDPSDPGERIEPNGMLFVENSETRLIDWAATTKCEIID